jgi:hypothetical protein
MLAIPGSSDDTEDGHLDWVFCGFLQTLRQMMVQYLNRWRSTHKSKHSQPSSHWSYNPISCESLNKHRHSNIWHWLATHGPTLLILSRIKWEPASVINIGEMRPSWYLSSQTQPERRCVTIVSDVLPSIKLKIKVVGTPTHFSGINTDIRNRWIYNTHIYSIKTLVLLVVIIICEASA